MCLKKLQILWPFKDDSIGSSKIWLAQYFHAGYQIYAGFLLLEKDGNYFFKLATLQMSKLTFLRYDERKSDVITMSHCRCHTNAIALPLVINMLQHQTLPSRLIK